LSGSAAVAVAGFLAWDSPSPFEPRGEGERVPIGSVIERGVTPDSARWYSFAAGSNSVYAVFVEASREVYSSW